MRRVAIVLLLLVFAPLHSAELDKDLADFKRDVLEVNKRLRQLEEGLLLPANSQVGIYLSLDEGPFFEPASIVLKLDGVEIASHLYSPKEVNALRKGAVQRLTLISVTDGRHVLEAEVTGQDKSGGEIREQVVGHFEKGPERHFVKLQIVDDGDRQSPRFYFQDWR